MVGRLLLAVVLSAMTTVAALADTRYVSLSGSDAADGASWGAALRTIARCILLSSAGDTCEIEPGAYAVDVLINKSGAPGAYITLRNASATGQVTVSKLSITGDYARVEGFTVIGVGANRGIEVDGDYGEVLKTHVRSVAGGAPNAIGIEIEGSSNVIRQSSVRDFCYGMIVSGANNLVEANEATLLGKTGGCGDVDYSRFFGSGHTFRANRFYGIDFADAVGAHIDCFQTFDTNGGHVYDIVIEGNACSDASQGVIMQAISYGLSSGVTIRNNVFTRLSAWCANNHDVANVKFFNNTCDTDGSLHGLWCRGSRGTASCEFKNNIVVGEGTFYGVFEAATLIDGTVSAPGKNNLLYRAGTTITGFDNDIKNLDPLLASPAAGDYRIKLGSPAINAGVTIAGWSSPTDKAGVARPVGAAWDIGAYESTGAPNPPTNPRPAQEEDE